MRRLEYKVSGVGSLSFHPGDLAEPATEPPVCPMGGYSVLRMPPVSRGDRTHNKGPVVSFNFGPEVTDHRDP